MPYIVQKKSKKIKGFPAKIAGAQKSLHFIHEITK